jgi:flavin-dependent dehydrogenase
MTRATLSIKDVGHRVWDVIVLGAGPGGAIAAYELAREGARTLLIEKRSFPRSKVCGSCLNMSSLATLRSLGLEGAINELGGVPLRALRLGYSARGIRLDLPGGLALSRAQLDLALVEAAIANGVSFLPRTCGHIGAVHQSVRHVELVQQGRSQTASARVILLATGLGSVRSLDTPFLQNDPGSQPRVGIGCTTDRFPDFYEAQTVFMAIGRVGYVGLVRVEGNRLNVAAAVTKTALKSYGGPGPVAEHILQEAGFAPISEFQRVVWQGTSFLTRRTWPIAGERFFVIGDTASYVEPFTGEGIAQAMLAGQVIAPLVRQGIHRWDPGLPRVWVSLHKRLIVRRQRLCWVITTLLRHRWITRIAFNLMTRFPQAARPIIRHVNTTELL